MCYKLHKLFSNLSTFGYTLYAKISYWASCYGILLTVYPMIGGSAALRHRMLGFIEARHPAVCEKKLWG